MLSKKKLVTELRKELKEDILERYDNLEYWDKDLIEIFIEENKLSDEQADELRDVICSME